MYEIMKFLICVSFCAVSNTAGAAPIQIIKSNVISEITYSSCEKLVAGTIVTSNCEQTFALEKPSVQFMDTHDLESVEIDFVSNINLKAAIRGQDPDWQSRDPLDLSNPENIFRLLADGGDALRTLLSYDGEACVGFLVDCRIDADWTYALGFEYAFSSGGFNLASELFKLDGQFKCEDSDPVGVVGFGTCGASETILVENMAGLVGVGASPSAVANFLVTPMELKVKQTVFSFLYDATDDVFDLQLNVLPYFEFNVIYNYKDKPVVIIDDNPKISAVPLPAGLPLVLTGLAGFVGLRIRKRKRRKAQV